MTKRKSTKSAIAAKVVPDREDAVTPTAWLAGTEHNPPIQDVVGAIFQNNSNVRQAIADNLRERSTEAKAFTSRARKAFAGFKPGKDQQHANYVKPGVDFAPTQEAVLTRGLDAFRNSTTPRSLKLAKSAELDKLIEAAPTNDDSIHGRIALSHLISHIEAKFIRSVARDTVIASCKAEIEAEKRMKEIMDLTPAVPGSSPAGTDPLRSPDKNLEEPASDASLISAKLVQKNVNLQMDRATSPESELVYSVPAHSDQMKDKHDKPTFELREGASDVTSFHDFHNLQIAFEDVWTEMFDDQLAVLGRQLFEEYVRLKDFNGMDNGQDLAINTIDDLRHFMDEIRDFSRLTTDSLPPALQPPPGSNGRSQNVIDKIVNDGGKVIKDVVDTLTGQNQEGGLTLDSFKAPLPLGDFINCTIELDRDDVPDTMVMIVLEAGSSIHGNIGLDFTDESAGVKWRMGPIGYGQTAICPPPIHAPASNGLFEFGRTISPGIMNGVYKFPLSIKPKTKITFSWILSGYTGP